MIAPTISNVNNNLPFKTHFRLRLVKNRIAVLGGKNSFIIFYLYSYQLRSKNTIQPLPLAVKQEKKKSTHPIMFNKISKFLKWRNNILQVQPVTFLKPVYRMTHYRCKTSYEIYTEGGITITIYYQAILIKKKKKNTWSHNNLKRTPKEPRR